MNDNTIDLNDLKKIVELGDLKEEDTTTREYTYAYGTYLLLSAQKQGIQKMTMEEGDFKIYQLEEWTKLTGTYFNQLEKSKRLLMKCLGNGTLSDEEMEEVMRLKDFAEKNLRAFYHKHFIEESGDMVVVYTEALNAGRLYVDIFLLDLEWRIYLSKHFKKIDEHIDLRRTLKVVEKESVEVEELSKRIAVAKGIDNLEPEEREKAYSMLSQMFERTTNLLNRRFFEMIYDVVDTSRNMN